MKATEQKAQKTNADFVVSKGVQNLNYSNIGTVTTNCVIQEPATYTSANTILQSGFMGKQ